MPSPRSVPPHNFPRREFVPSFAKTIPADAYCVFSGEIYDVYQWPQTMFDGSTATFEMLRRPDTVKIIAVKDEDIIIAHQRQPMKDWFYDFPGGRHDDPAENELAAAKRELLEETGQSFRNWRLIKVEQPFNKIDWLVYTFLATDYEGTVPQQLDAGEEIEVTTMSFEELQDLVASGGMEYTRARDIEDYFTLSDLLSAPALYEYK